MTKMQTRTAIDPANLAHGAWVVNAYRSVSRPILLSAAVAQNHVARDKSVSPGSVLATWFTRRASPGQLVVFLHVQEDSFLGQEDLQTRTTMEAVEKVLPMAPLRDKAEISKEETLPQTTTALAAPLLVTLQVEVVRLKVAKVAKAVTLAASRAHVQVPTLALVTTRVAPITLALVVQVQARMARDSHLLHASPSVHQTSSALAESACRCRTPYPAGPPQAPTVSSIAKTLFVHQDMPVSMTVAFEWMGLSAAAAPSALPTMPVFRKRASLLEIPPTAVVRRVPVMRSAWAIPVYQTQH